MRTRLCIQPVCQSWRMPASTIGTPVWPRCQARRPAACRLAPGQGFELRAQGGIGADAALCQRTGRRRNRARSARCRNTSARLRRRPCGCEWRATARRREISPQCKCGERREVRSWPGRLRPTSYPPTRAFARNSLARAWAAGSPGRPGIAQASRPSRGLVGQQMPRLSRFIASRRLGGAGDTARRGVCVGAGGSPRAAQRVREGREHAVDAAGLGADRVGVEQACVLRWRDVGAAGVVSRSSASLSSCCAPGGFGAIAGVDGGGADVRRQGRRRHGGGVAAAEA